MKHLKVDNGQWWFVGLSPLSWCVLNIKYMSFWSTCQIEKNHFFCFDPCFDKQIWVWIWSMFLFWFFLKLTNWNVEMFKKILLFIKPVPFPKKNHVFYFKNLQKNQIILKTDRQMFLFFFSIFLLLFIQPILWKIKFFVIWN